MNNKTIYLAVIAVLHFPAITQAETDKEWASAIGASSVEEFKSSAADTVPGYDAAYSNNITSDNISTEATIDAQTDEGAQIIYGLGGRPDVSGESWYQDAIDITQDPTSVYDMQDGEYSDCETTTDPGSEYTKEQSCTETALPETASCSIGRELEVDSHHLYECKSERDTSGGDCAVGRTIDVTEAAAYRCSKGETSYEKTCSTRLEIKVEEVIKKYEPSDICIYEDTESNALAEYIKDGQPWESMKVIGYTPTFSLPYSYDMVRKPSQSCDINAYSLRRQFNELIGGDAYEEQIEASTQFIANIITGNKIYGCRPGDELAPDGYCYSSEAIQFTAPDQVCEEGATLDNGICISSPSWQEHYHLDYKNYTVSKLVSYELIKNNTIDWFTLRYLTYSGGVIGKQSLSPLLSKTWTLTDNATGKVIYAKIGSLKQIVDSDYSYYKEYDYSILVSNTLTPSESDPIIQCSSGELDSETNQCYSIAAEAEQEVTENWVEECE